MAGEMAQKFDAELALLYVIRDTQIPDGVQKMADVELFHETRLTAMQMVGKQIVDECETQVRSLGADKVKSEVRPGDPPGSSSIMLTKPTLTSLSWGRVALAISRECSWEVFPVKLPTSPR